MSAVYNLELQRFLARGRVDPAQPPPDVSIGRDSVRDRLDSIAALGRTVLFCTGFDSMKRVGAHRKCLELFSSRGISVRELSGIGMNPSLERIDEAIEIARGGKIDFIFCLGGGSVIDTGKAVSVGLFGDLWVYVNEPARIEKAVPVVACTTTSGTGSHVTPYAVITNSATKEKKTLKHPLLLPRLSLVNTDLLRHIPATLTATTGFDVLCHAIEVFTRKDCDSLTADLSLRAIALVGKHLVGAFRGHDDTDRTGMAYADIFAGMALGRRGTHLAHAISHPISGRFPEISHGQALASISIASIEHQLRGSDRETKRRYAMLGSALSGDDDLVGALRRLIRDLQLDRNPTRLEAKDLQLIYQDTLRYRWESAAKCPVPVEPGHVWKIISESLG